MTVQVSALSTKLIYTGPGEYSFDFEYLRPGDIQVSIDTGVVTRLLALGDDYTLTNRVCRVLDSSAHAGLTGHITIRRLLPYDQPTNWVNNSPLDVELLEYNFDRIVMQIQQLWHNETSGYGLVNWRGQWQPNIQYYVKDLVRLHPYDLYYAIADSQEASFNPVHWERILDGTALNQAVVDATTAAAEATTKALEALNSANAAASSAGQAENSLLTITNLVNTSTTAIQAQVNLATSAANTATTNAATAQGHANAAALSATSADASAIEAAASAASVNSDLIRAAIQLRSDNNSGQFWNGDFQVAQQATQHSTEGYGSIDGIYNSRVGSSCTVSQQEFPLSHALVPGEQRTYLRAQVISVAGADNYAVIAIRLPEALLYNNSKLIVAFRAKADGNKNIAVEASQNLGAGVATPWVDVPPKQVSLTPVWPTDWILCEFNMPSLAGKVIGTRSFVQITFWLDAGANRDSHTLGLGQQNIVFDLSTLRIVRNIYELNSQCEDWTSVYTKCMRHLQIMNCTLLGYAPTNARVWAPYTFPVPMVIPPTPLDRTPGNYNTSVILSDITRTGLTIMLGPNSGGSGEIFSHNRTYWLSALH